MVDAHETTHPPPTRTGDDAGTSPKEASKVATAALDIPSAAATTSEQKLSDADVHSLFEPYRRISPPIDPAEFIKTAIVAVTLLPFRLLFLVLTGALLWLISFIAMAGMKDKTAYLHTPLPQWRKMLLAAMFPLIRAIAFVTFGVYHIKSRRIEYDSLPESLQMSQLQPSSSSTNSDSPLPGPGEEAPDAYVVVANHLGYLDIIVLLARYRGSFVAKGAIEKVAAVGTIATALQCMFVREGTPLTTQLINRVQTTYACHMNRSPKCPGCGSCMNKVIIFPEGTTTNGTAMVPFRSGVFNAGLPVRPVCIQFPYRHFNLSWETIRFRDHLFRTLTQVRNNVVMTELPPYSPNVEEQEDGRLYAANVQRYMAQVLGQAVVPLNRKHKFLYHSYLLGKVKDPTEIYARAEKLTSEDPILSSLEQTGNQIV